MKNNIILIGSGVTQSLTEGLFKALSKDNTIVKPTLIVVGSISEVLKPQYDEEKIGRDGIRDKMYKYYTSHISKFKGGVDSVIFINTPNDERNYIVNNRNIYKAIGVEETKVSKNEYYVFSEKANNGPITQKSSKNNYLRPVKIRDKQIIENNTGNYFIVTYSQLFENNSIYSKIGLLTYTPYFKYTHESVSDKEPLNVSTSIFLANYLKTGVYTDVYANVTVNNLINILKIENEK